MPNDFSGLGLSTKVTEAVTAAGYTTPTDIQAQAIPHVLQKRDIIGIAQTGTGKTASFVLPMLTLLESGRARARMPRTLILEPTRELAAQVHENFERYGKNHRLSVALLIGGVSFEEQNKKLDRGADVLIATPGRMLDQFERGRILLSGVDILVMNESESVHITDIAVHDLRTANEAAMVLHEIGVGIVVFTLGAKGAIFSSGSDIVHLPGFMVQAVDTTAAGDAFVGALAFGLARNMLLPDAVRLANAAGALAVTRLGAQPSLPRGQEVREFLKKMKPVQ